MTPLVAALSMRLMASRSASGVVSAPVEAAVSAVLVRVFSSARTALLRSRRFSLVLLRLIWLLMLATAGNVLGNEKRPAGGPGNASSAPPGSPPAVGTLD